MDTLATASDVLVGALRSCHRGCSAHLLLRRDTGSPAHNFAHTQQEQQAETLSAAAASGDADAVSALLSAGAHPDGLPADEYGIRLPSLHAACRNGKAACVSLLLKAGAAPDLLTGRGSSAADVAVAGDHAACLRLLFDTGRVYLLGSDGPGGSFAVAATAGALECMRMLRERGPDPLADVAAAAAALTSACCYGHRRVAEYLLLHGASPHL